MNFNLKVPPSDVTLSCSGSNSKCDTCSIGPNGLGFCPGCRGHCGPNGPSNMWRCNRECMTCGGNELAKVPAICCKSPLAEPALKSVHRDAYSWTKRPLLQFKQKGIIVIQGSMGRFQDPFPPETEVVAVNIRHVWSRNGWFSTDMRDYLRIPSKTKLCLLTMTHDDVLERAWDLNVHEEDYARIGFDFWQPLTFSMYLSDSKMNMYYQWRRTLKATESSAAWFTPGIPWLMTRKVDEIHKEMAGFLPQLMINAQFLPHDEALRSFLRVLIREHSLHPKTVPFWFVGPSNLRLVKILKSFLRGREVYCLATAPWLAGHKGAEFTNTGKNKKSDLPKAELLHLNQRAYMEMVATA